MEKNPKKLYFSLLNLQLDFDVFPGVNGNFHGQGVIIRRLYHHRFISLLSVGDTAVKYVQKLTSAAHIQNAVQIESLGKKTCAALVKFSLSYLTKPDIASGFMVTEFKDSSLTGVSF